MPDGPILICYDGSDESDRAIEAAAALLVPRHAIVVDVGPVLTPLESEAALAPVVPGGEFEETNADGALRRAQAGAVRARRAGFTAEARGEVAAPTWEGIVGLAQKIDAAVIVMGSRSLTGARALAESLSRQVAEHAGRPVLIVPR